MMAEHRTNQGTCNMCFKLKCQICVTVDKCCN